jgi:hypothetical protein
MLPTNPTCPPSTLLMLIAGLERIKAAYAHRPPGTASSPTATTAEMPRRGRRHRFKAALALIIGSAA